MHIKGTDSQSDFISSLNSIFANRKWKFLLFLLVLIIYSGFMISTGVVLKKYAFWSVHLKPFLLTNINTPINYLNSFAAKPKKITIDIKHKDYLKLAHKRQQALAAGKLQYSAGEDWVPAKITYEGKTYKIKIRLKGTRDPHWIDENFWSYKIKMKGNETLFGMKRFAIQVPDTRGYLNEWYFHKLFAEMGLISLRYDYLDVTINGKHFPVYALEENFDKRLIENNRRREGPIFWARLHPKLKVEATEAYQENKYLQDPGFTKLIQSAESLVESFRQGNLPASKVFDIDKMAKLYAILDLAGESHTLGFDNIRFYLNPVTSLLEPIAYDNQLMKTLSDNDVLGEGQQIQVKEPIPVRYSANEKNTRMQRFWLFEMFRDREFFQSYVHYLEQVSNKEFLDHFFSKTEEEAQEKLKIIHRGYPHYSFVNKPVLYKNQEYIRNLLSPEKTVQGYIHQVDEKKQTVWIDLANIHPFPVEVTSLSVDGKLTLEPAEKILLQAKHVNSPMQFKLVKFTLPPGTSWTQDMASKLIAKSKILGGSKTISNTITGWARDGDFIRQDANPDQFSFLAVDESNKIIQIKSGNWAVKKNMILPKGYRVQAFSGTNLTLTNQAKILSYSPLDFKGTEKNPIVISSDETGQGMIVMGAKGKSTLDHVVFKNLSNPAQAGWSVPGAVTFYESPVKLQHVKFLNARCEDGLNIFRSPFEINNSFFQKTLSDAFDSDFSKGTISHSKFVDIGNDAIDVSGSDVRVSHVVVHGAGDKGISAGEDSRMEIDHLEEINTNIGVASKDKSIVKIKDLQIKDSKFGFAVFQKKKEFGPGKIEVEGIKMAGMETPYLVEKGSSLTVDGTLIKNEYKNIKKFLY